MTRIVYKQLIDKVDLIMELIKDKPRRKSVSELFDWRYVCNGDKCDTIVDDNGEIEEMFMKNNFYEGSNDRRRRRSGTWP